MHTSFNMMISFNIDKLLRLTSAMIMPLIFLLASFLIYILILYYYNPLYSIPGPLLARVSPLWLLYSTRRRTRHVSDMQLHQKYGPVVLISPNQVSVASSAALKTIYGIGKRPFPKGEWYSGLSTTAEVDFQLVAQRDTERHRYHRRLISPLYSDASCRDMEPLLTNGISHVIREMRLVDQKESDINDLCNRMMLDFMSPFGPGRMYGERHSWRHYRHGPSAAHDMDPRTLAGVVSPHYCALSLEYGQGSSLYPQARHGNKFHCGHELDRGPRPGSQD